MSIDDFLARRGISNAECARQVGVSREMIGRYRKRLSVPTAEIKIKIAHWSEGKISAVFDWPCK